MTLILSRHFFVWPLSSRAHHSGEREGGNLERIFEQKSGDLRRILTGGGLSRRSVCRTLVKSCYQHPWFSILS